MLFDVQTRSASACRVPALSIVEDLEVLEDCVREPDARVPSLPIEKLDLESTPEGLDHRVVIAVADGSHRG